MVLRRGEEDKGTPSEIRRSALTLSVGHKRRLRAGSAARIICIDTSGVAPKTSRIERTPPQRVSSRCRSGSRFIASPRRRSEGSNDFTSTTAHLLRRRTCMTYRVLTSCTPPRRIGRIFLFHNGLNELDRMGLYYQLASEIIASHAADPDADEEEGVACILRPFPGHLTRAVRRIRRRTAAQVPLGRLLSVLPVPPLHDRDLVVPQRRSNARATAARREPSYCWRKRIRRTAGLTPNYFQERCRKMG